MNSLNNLIFNKINFNSLGASNVVKNEVSQKQQQGINVDLLKDPSTFVGYIDLQQINKGIGRAVYDSLDGIFDFYSEQALKRRITRDT